MTDSPQALAEIVLAYAKMRAAYLHGNDDFNGKATTDNDRHLMMEQAGLEKAALIVANPHYDTVELGLPSWFSADDWEAAVAAARTQHNHPYIAPEGAVICHSCRSVVVFVETAGEYNSTHKCPVCGLYRKRITQ